VKKSDLRTKDYIEHMLEAIGRIREYVAPLSHETFESTQMAVDAVVRNIEIIGEAAHPEIPWQDIYAMRNRVSHGYFAINTQVVWVTIQRDLPELERDLLRLEPK
jgi:uncharacterized protein with HEPN domain